MALLQTQQAVVGFVASDPKITYNDSGDARLYLKVGIEHYRREEDNSFTKLETTFHDLVTFQATAERAHEKLAKGDKLIAVGWLRQYSYEREGQRFEGEEFVAKRLGHDMARTRYEVDRTPRQSAPTQAEITRDAAPFHSPERPSHERPVPTMGM